MQAEDSVTIKACKDFISKLISIRTRFVKGFVLPPVAHYPFRRHVLFIAKFQAICSLYCNVQTTYSLYYNMASYKAIFLTYCNIAFFMWVKSLF